MIIFFFIVIPCCFVGNSLSFSQQSVNDLTEMQKKATTVFLDVESRYQEYIIMEIPFVNYVRDRKEAQVHILLTQQQTGSGGSEYTLTFIGQQNYTGLDDTLTCVTQQMDPEDIVRRSIVNTIKIGLIPYISKTPLAKDISIVYRQRTDPTAVMDRWNYWVFNIDTSSRYNAEESSEELSLEGSFSADRVTPDWKISFAVDSEYDREAYDTDERTISSFTRSQEFEGLIVKSIGEHWSAGVYGSAESSSYTNTKFLWNIAPAVEFNVFPYAESTRREFRILYKTRFTDIRYVEETLYDKIHENFIR